jgi:hypothetical protein
LYYKVISANVRQGLKALDKGFLLSSIHNIAGKHVEQDHVVLLKRYVKEVHTHPQNLLDKKLVTKWQIVISNAISKYFSFSNPFTKNHEA